MITVNFPRGWVRQKCDRGGLMFIMWLLYCMYVLVAQLCPTLWDPMACSPPGSSVHGILQARILECVAISFSREPSQSRDQTQVFHMAGIFFTIWATRRNTTDLGAGILFSRASQVALMVKNPPANAGDPRDAGSIPRETPWRRKWQPTPVFSSVQFSSVQSLSHVWLWLFATPGTAAHQASLSIINSWSLLKLMSIQSLMPSNYLILCHPLLRLPSIFPSIRVCSNESVLCISGQSIGVSASVLVLPMNIQDWFPFGWTGWISLLSKGLSRVFCSKASILWHLAFFTVQLSYPYMTTGKTIALTRYTFVTECLNVQ